MKPTTITAYPVMLPTDKALELNKAFLLISHNRLSNKDELQYGVVLNLEPTFPITRQLLYLTSDEEIKEGDWVEADGMVTQIDESQIQMMESKPDAFTHVKKIVATTDSSLSTTESGKPFADRDIQVVLPWIPESFIKQWVESNGTIESVELVMEVNHIAIQAQQTKPSKEGMVNLPGRIEHQLKTTEDNSVIIHQEEEKMYSKESIIERLKPIMEEYEIPFSVIVKSLNNI